MHCVSWPILCSFNIITITHLIHNLPNWQSTLYHHHINIMSVLIITLYNSLLTVEPILYLYISLYPIIHFEIHPPTTQISSKVTESILTLVKYLFISNHQTWIRLTLLKHHFQCVWRPKGERLCGCSSLASLTNSLFFVLRTCKCTCELRKQSNWTASRRAWTRSTPICERLRRTWVAWRSVADCVCYPAISEYTRTQQTNTHRTDHTSRQFHLGGKFN